MAKIEEHCRDCEILLGDKCEEVNRWIDEEFRRFGPFHRFRRHHTRGVMEAEKLFGELGRKAATIHILKDCGHIPTARDWEEGRVDSLGMLEYFNGFWDPKEFLEEAKKLIGENYETTKEDNKR